MRAVLFLFFATLSFFVAGQSDDRVKLRDLQEAPGNDYIIVSLNDTAHWVLPASIMVNLYTSNGTIDAVRQVTLSDAAQLIIGDTSETVLFTMYPDEFNPQIGLSTTSDDNTETSMLFLQQSDAQIQSGNAGNYTVLMIDNDGHVTVTRTTGAASFAVNAGDPDATLDIGGGAIFDPDSLTYSAGLNRIVTIDSLTGRLHYINATDIETGGSAYYQTLRDDGTPLTQRDAINFVGTSTVATTLTDDAGNGETEVALSVPTGGITSTQILDGTITTSDLAFTPAQGTGANNHIAFWTGTNTLSYDNNLLVWDNTNNRVGIWTASPSQPLHVNGNFRMDGNMYDNRGNTVLQQSGSGVASNRDFTFGNATYGRNMWFFKSNSFTTGTHPALGGYTFYAHGETSTGATAGNTYFKTQSAAAATSANGGDFIIELGVKGTTGTRDGRVAIGNTSPAAKLDVTGDGKFSTTLGVGITPTSGTALFVHGTGATSATVNTLLENSSGTDLLYLDDSGQLGLLTNLPARTLHVAGEARITDLTTDAPTRIVGADADGDLNEITVSSELLLSGGVLSVGTLSHAALSDLGSPEDDHDQYLNIFGRAGGQIVYGATGASENLDLNSTTNATKGNILLQDEGGNVIIGGAATASRLRMMEASGSGTNYTEFVAQAQAANVTYTLPPDDGDSGEQLQTNGSGGLSWQPPGGDIDFEVYDIAGSYTYNIPTGAKAIDIITIGGGGGGGSGRKGATTDANTGGGGGGGGGYSRVLFVVSQLSASSLDIDVGAGGTGGASVSTSSTNGSGGADGEITTVYCSGFLLCAGGPGDGGGGGSTGASTGGVDATIGDILGQNGGSCATDGVAAAGDASNNKAPGGGGSGGGIPAGGTPAKNGSRSAKYNYGQDQITNNGTVASPDAGDATANAQQITGGGGGAGGASSIASSGGDGGDGIMGSGGGGGGAALNGVGDSGAGGAGGTGWVLLIVKY